MFTTRWLAVRMVFLAGLLSCEGPVAVFAQTTFLGTRAGQERDDNGLAMKFCWCPAGQFTMGSPTDEPDRFEDEGQTQVTLSRGFWLGKYEVTQGEWQKLMGTNPSSFSPAGANQEKVAGQTTERFPVETVSWEAVTEFCKKLTDQERKAGRLQPGWEYRLPTEAQWEYACRGGTAGATAFGNSLTGNQANFNGIYPYNATEKGPYLRRTTAVGSYKPNAWGLCDMHGNVAELCRDGYAEKRMGGRDPEVTQATSHRLFRGGGWGSNGGLCRSAFRLKIERGVRDDYLGFRVAAVSIEQAQKLPERRSGNGSKSM